MEGVGPWGLDGWEGATAEVGPDRRRRGGLPSVTRVPEGAPFDSGGRSGRSTCLRPSPHTATRSGHDTPTRAHVDFGFHERCVPVEGRPRVPRGFYQKLFRDRALCPYSSGDGRPQGRRATSGRTRWNTHRLSSPCLLSLFLFPLSFVFCPFT